MTWNKNKSVGQKKPFSPKQVRLLKDILLSKNLTIQLALFSLGIDTMLRAGDLLKLFVEDVLDHKGEIRSEIKIKQQKTKEPHIVMISEETKEYLNKWITESKKYDGDYLFTSKRGNKPLSVRWYRELVKSWVKLLGLDTRDYSTHSIRRTRASLIYKNTGNIEAVRLLLGQKSVASTSSYLNLDKQEALKIGREFVI
ncbi:MAG: tyrosine-type recombinase/integrase [Rickettsiales bacterium]|nr:tyrosine-type recombinase/integrase [Rickettsiales bacterium]